MRIAVVGKGGAGKSVIAGTSARLLARQGRRVLALDSDLLPGLSISLGSGPDPVDPPLEPPGKLARVLEARHLAPRVDAGVRSPRDGERHGLLEYLLERGAQLTLDRSQPRLGRPAAEGAAVVGERQPYGQSNLTKMFTLGRTSNFPAQGGDPDFGLAHTRRARGRPSRSRPSGADRA